MTIGYICDTNPFEDRFAWSGTIFKIREAIETSGFDVVWIPFYKTTRLVKLSEKIRWYLYDLLGKKQILGGSHFLPELFAYANSIKKDEIFNNCDVFFFPGGGQIGLFLNTQKPIIYYADATTFGMIDYYWKNCLPLSIKMANYLEKKACQRASLNLRSSKWAADSVVNDCKCEPSKCIVLEFGANIDTNDIQPITPYRSGQLNILFSGVDWERKGGDIAVETARLLRKNGIDAILHIVGIKQLPDYCKTYDFIKFHGFLNKNNRESYQRYIDIIKKCHIMLLPTQAECSAIVYSEAAGFGLPTYTYATGGTTNYVIDGINGYALKPEMKSNAFANQIIQDIGNNRLLDLHKGALRLYEDKLSWNAWSHRFNKIMNSHFHK